MESAEQRRLHEDATRQRNWKRWGPYLSNRQWGTVREDYSATGECWDYLPHDHARSRAYRCGEDALLGITGGESRRGRKRVLLLPGFDRHAFLHDGAVQVPAG